MNILAKTFAVAATILFCASSNAQTVMILGGATGNADFEASEPAAGPIQYIDTLNWFNASGSEGINFTNDSQTGGSSQPGSRAGMPFMNRVQINNTGYTVASAGEVISLSYDFGAGGNPGNWDGPTDESMRTFLFTAAAPVDGFLTTDDMTEIASDSYPIDLANDGQWTSYSVSNFYTTTAADVGTTIYFGMVFENSTGPDLFPRIDVITLQVNTGGTTTVIGGDIANGNFEATEPFVGPQFFSDTPNWFNASGSEGVNGTNDTQTGGASDPDSRAGLPFADRIIVNSSGYTVVAEGTVFSLSYDFGRVGLNWDDDETFRTFLFTASAAVGGNLTTADMSEFAEVVYTIPSSGFWENGIQQNAFYTTTAADIGETFYFGMEMLNPAGDDVFPRVDEISLIATPDGGDVLLGDVNCDGIVNLLDVAPFVAAISSGMFNAKADINEDGVVNLLDVNPFVDILNGG